jgi:hypothetical protein
MSLLINLMIFHLHWQQLTLLKGALGRNSALKLHVGRSPVDSPFEPLEQDIPLHRIG